jgi:hypothetical protein
MRNYEEDSLANLPIISRNTTNTSGGTELMEHSKWPSSRSFTYLMCSCQSFGCTNSTEYRESLLYVDAPVVMRCICSPFLFVHITCKWIEKKESRINIDYREGAFARLNIGIAESARKQCEN